MIFGLKTWKLAKELLRYDIEQIDEDLFKEIYQEIVKRSERHRIGEYYTPEWLAELTLKEALSIWFEKNKDKNVPRILDPACGSGTFLCNAIHMIKDILEKRGYQSTEILNFILNGIVGIDTNPLAVIIARANYLIALGELLKVGKKIVVPVYVADSIRLPEVKTVYSYAANENIQVYEVTVNDYKIQIPSEIAKNRYKLGQVLNGLREALNVYRTRKEKNEAKALFNRKASGVISQAELEILNMTLDTLLKLMDKQLNEIWIYILNNIYAPVVLKEMKFDILTGNPPWIAMRYIENKNYQDWLKQNIFAYGLLSSDQVHLFTQMEIATLFYNRCADLYLKEKDSVIAFVMPRSVLTGAFHHIHFKEFKMPKMRLIKILDCENVTPLFNVPSCVLIALKGEENRYPVLASKFSGKLERKNVKLYEVLSSLKLENYAYEPPLVPSEKSYYYEEVKNGAAIYPRPLWFIDFEVLQALGAIDINLPRVKSAIEARKLAKGKWKNVCIEGNIETDFIYATSLEKDLVSFGLLKIRPIILPIEKTGSGKFRLFDEDELRTKGYIHMATWLSEAQKIWKEKRSEKEEKLFPEVINRLNYQNLLTNQGSKRFVTIYNSHGTNIASCVIDRQMLPSFLLPNTRIEPRDFIIENAFFYYETNNEKEAHYLCALLNSNVVNDAVKPLQPKGLFGERAIHRRPFMFSIPKFDPNNPIHLRLAELSKISHEKVANAKTKFTGKTIASLRKQAREVVKDELREIDKLVSELLELLANK